MKVVHVSSSQTRTWRKLNLLEALPQYEALNDTSEQDEKQRNGHLETRLESKSRECFRVLETLEESEPRVWRSVFDMLANKRSFEGKGCT